jgi:hypothetical protein
MGFGARLDLEGPYIPQSLRTAGLLKLDWISIDFDWTLRRPLEIDQPNLCDLDTAVKLAEQNKLAVMLRISHAPDWAMTEVGPDPEATARLVSYLVDRYSGMVQAVELFPKANTESGWGTAPDPEAYAEILQAVNTVLVGSDVFTIAGGLVPLPLPLPNNQDINDLDFLQALYNTGAVNDMQVVSMCLTLSTGSPLQPPIVEEHRVLRHYEEIRQVMLATHHENNLIWITQFSLPSGKINTEDVAYQVEAENQFQWLSQAYKQLRSQLYIGVTFLVTINPSGTEAATGNEEVNLLYPDLTRHPICKELKELAEINTPTKVILIDFNKPQSKNIVKIRGSPP